jgi:hypothetical protein
MDVTKEEAIQTHIFHQMKISAQAMNLEKSTALHDRI